MPIIRSMDGCRWHKAHETEKHYGELFLRKQEKLCVAACARFRTLNFIEDHAWLMSQAANTLAMLLHSRRTIFPVFNGMASLSIPAYLYRALENIKIHALHGCARDVETLLKLLSPLSLEPVDYVNYYLMTIDDAASLPALAVPPRGLTLRRPNRGDIERLLIIQAEYEKEEVLPPGASLNPYSVRLTVDRMLAGESALVAELDRRLVGKININAEGWSRCQIGGVYVIPDCRGTGIGRHMTQTFVRLLISRGWGINLFARTNNFPALKTYLGAGFKKESNYSIVYI
jgi:ribosomal protein S18 acetylase RimI-like enzyme